LTIPITSYTICSPASLRSDHLIGINRNADRHHAGTLIDFPGIRMLRKLEDTGLIFAHTWDWEPREVFAQSNSEEEEVNVPEDREGTDLFAQEDWEIPF
jgi:hypothetical protein